MFSAIYEKVEQITRENVELKKRLRKIEDKLSSTNNSRNKDFVIVGLKSGTPFVVSSTYFENLKSVDDKSRYLFSGMDTLFVESLGLLSPNMTKIDLMFANNCEFKFEGRVFKNPNRFIYSQWAPTPDTHECVPDFGDPKISRDFVDAFKNIGLNPVYSGAHVVSKFSHY